MAKQKIQRTAAFMIIVLVIFSSIFMSGCSRSTCEFEGSISNLIIYEDYYEFGYTYKLTTKYDDKITFIKFNIEILDEKNNVIETKIVHINISESYHENFKSDKYMHQGYESYQRIKKDKGKPTSLTVSEFTVERAGSKLYAIFGGILGGVVAVGLVAAFIVIKNGEIKKSKSDIKNDF